MPATSAAIGPQTYRVRVVASTAAPVTIGDATGMYLAHRTFLASS
jgi:hypothetical protein